MTDILDLAVTNHAALSLKDADPLSYWRFAVPRVAQAIAMFSDPDDPLDELALRGPNKSGKTETKAAIMLSCLQKRDSLDGVPLPSWRGRVEGAQLVLDYQQQLLSVKPAYLRLLGSWPHHVRYIGEALSSIHVKPIGCDTDNEAEWSVVHFLTQKNRDTGVGVRADVIDFDEPASMEILREMRKAAHAGRRCIILHGFTPTRRSQWAPVREDYGDTPRRSIRRINEERAEVRWSLDELAPWVLDAGEKAKLLRTYAGDPLHTPESSAREHGDYTNTEGSCPFDVPTLVWLTGFCRTPSIEVMPITLERLDGEGVDRFERVPVEVFVAPRPGITGYVTVDPSSGSSTGHKAGVMVCEVGTANLLAYWEGQMAPYSVGVLAATLARQYGDSFVDIEMKDHWGVNVVRGCEKGAQYYKLSHEMRELRPGHWSKEAGWDMNEEAKAAIIGSIQEWLSALKAANRVTYGECPSRVVLDTVLDAELDDRGKIVAGPGIQHGVGMILWGRSLLKAARRSLKPIPVPLKPPPTEAEIRNESRNRLAAIIQGKKPLPHRNGGQPTFGKTVLAPRKAPR